MNFRSSIAIILAFVAAVAGSSALYAASVATEGLVGVSSRNLDELYLRPGTNLATYRKVMIDPVRVGFHKDWLKYGYTANAVRPVGDDQAKRIAVEIARDAQANIAEAFKARGYEIVSAPGPGVLRLSAGVADLFVNAPERHSPWRERAFTREAGQVVLLLDARDSVSGTLLARVVHHGIADQMGRFTRANDVSNRFWFDALSRRWAISCVAELSPH